GVAVILVSQRVGENRRIASCGTVKRGGQGAGEVKPRNNSTLHIVVLMVGRDHVVIFPVVPQGIFDPAEWEVLSAGPKRQRGGI
ncbi:hypothetical protein Q2366_25655, partial [Escherichia coli]|nr:hypothetical protein [Escherichia coli]